MRIILLTAASALALTIAQPALMHTPVNVTMVAAAAEAKNAEDFARMAAQSNMLEIASSQLALKNSKNAEIKAFAQQMIDDHTNAGKQLQEAAAKEKVTKLPSKLNKKHQEKMDTLNKASAADFDKQYVQMQVQAHEDAVELFTGWSKQTGALSDLAKAMLPKLQQHLEMARKLTVS